MRKVADMIAEANEIIEVISAEDAIAMKDRDDVTFLDIRDIRELWRDGKIPGAQHAPRGMLEFWVDPHSPYYKDRMFPEGNKFVFYWAGGGRSALAAKALHEMGVPNVAHIGTGFKGWKEADGGVEEVNPK